jgi:hypothetical protein
MEAATGRAICQIFSEESRKKRNKKANTSQGKRKGNVPIFNESAFCWDITTAKAGVSDKRIKKADRTDARYEMGYNRIEVCRTKIAHTKTNRKKYTLALVMEKRSKGSKQIVPTKIRSEIERKLRSSPGTEPDQHQRMHQ